MRLLGLFAFLLICGCGRVPVLPEIDREPERRCSGEACDATPVLIDEAAPVTLWSVRFDGAMKLPADDGLDWYGLVLRGSLTVDGCGELGAWWAFRVAQGGVTVRGKGDAVLGAASGKALSKLGALGPAKAGDVAGKCESVNVKTLPEVTWAHRTAHARLVFRGGRGDFGLIYSAEGAGSRGDGGAGPPGQ